MEPDNIAAIAVIDDDDQQGALIRPAASLERIEQVFKQYQSLTKRLLTEDDYQQIGRKKFPKRSAWRKLATAFGVTFEIADRHIEYDDDYDVIRSDFIVRATAPNGRFADGWGGCDRKERCCTKGCQKDHSHCPAGKGEICPGVVHFSHPNHDIPATAETRAKNRAAADLFGLGQVSAEEIVDSGSRRRTAPRRDVAAPAEPEDDRPTRAQMAALEALAVKLHPDEPGKYAVVFAALNTRQAARELLQAMSQEVASRSEAENAEGK